jgi:hypothetical protein
MKTTTFFVLAVVLIMLLTATIVSAKPAPSKEISKDEEKRLDAIMKVKDRLIEKRGYDPSMWPPGLVELFMDYGILR